jgi:hypothetical protein
MEQNSVSQLSEFLLPLPLDVRIQVLQPLDSGTFSSLALGTVFLVSLVLSLVVSQTEPQ